MARRPVRDAIIVVVVTCIGCAVPVVVMQVRDLPSEGILGAVGGSLVVAIAPVIVLVAAATGAQRSSGMLTYSLMNGVVYGLAAAVVVMITSRRGWWRWVLLGLLASGWLAYAHVLSNALPSG